MLSSLMTEKYLLTMIVNPTPILVILTIEAQYGNPMTVFRATQGVKTVTPKFRTDLMT